MVAYPSIAELKTRVSLADIVGGTVHLRKKGGELVGLCPFHQEKTPSFTIYSTTGGDDKYHCFGCGVSGDVVEYLMASNGLSVIEAKDELARMAGGGAVPAAMNTPTDRRPDPKPADVWKTVFPAPDEIPSRIYSPRSNKWSQYLPSMAFAYRDAGGALLGYVFRIDKAGGGKITPQITYCEHTESGELRWCARHFDTPRPLYNLQNLKPTGTVLIVEGEKCADAAQRLVGDKVSVIGWPGGGNGVKYADWRPLDGRRCVIWPDADEPGGKAAASVRENIQGDALVIAAPADVVKGWDVADAEVEGWSATRTWDFLTGAVKAARPDTPATKNKAPKNKAPKPGKSGKREFVALGYSGEYFFYLSRRLSLVERLTAGQHNDKQLLRLAALEYWEAQYPGKRGTDWLQAADSLILQCSKTGVFDPGRVRGRGAWFDKGRAVFHLGDRLVVDGASMDPIDFSDSSQFVYPVNTALADVTAAEPLPDAESAEVLETAKAIRWVVPGSAFLCAGWTALAPICGALSWRPHIWITGAAGSGKSTILADFVRPLLAGIEVFAAGDTTAAGIRQTLKDDAFPVIFDEAEGAGKHAQTRLAALLELMRASASDTGALTIKGTASHTATSFNIRSMFAMGSISSSVTNHADESRIVELELAVPRADCWSENESHWLDLQKKLSKIGDPEFARRLVARTIQNIPAILENVATFRRAAAEHFNSQRSGDTLGVLLAGAYSLVSTKIIKHKPALDFIESKDWKSHMQPDATAGDEAILLALILESQFVIKSPHNIFDTNVGEALIRAAGLDDTGDEVTFTAAEARANLMRLGIKISDGGEDFIISDSHKGIAKLLQGSSWDGRKKWGSILARFAGAERLNLTRFGALSHRAVALPITILHTDSPGLI